MSPDQTFPLSIDWFPARVTDADAGPPVTLEFSEVWFDGSDWVDKQNGRFNVLADDPAQLLTDEGDYSEIVLVRRSSGPSVGFTWEAVPTWGYAAYGKAGVISTAGQTLGLGKKTAVGNLQAQLGTSQTTQAEIGMVSPPLLAGLSPPVLADTAAGLRLQNDISQGFVGSKNVWVYKAVGPTVVIDAVGDSGSFSGSSLTLNAETVVIYDSGGVTHSGQTATVAGLLFTGGLLTGGSLSVTVAAGSVTAGTFGAGVLLPAGQITSGTIGAGVTISGGSW